MLQVPTDLWTRIQEYTIPVDAHVFYLGSYSSNKRGGTLRDEDVVWNLVQRDTDFVFDLFTSEQDSGQQIEQVTLDMVLDSQEEYNVWLAEVKAT